MDAVCGIPRYDSLGKTGAQNNKKSGNIPKKWYLSHFAKIQKEVHTDAHTHTHAPHVRSAPAGAFFISR